MVMQGYEYQCCTLRESGLMSKTYRPNGTNNPEGWPSSFSEEPPTTPSDGVEDCEDTMTAPAQNGITDITGRGKPKRTQWYGVVGLEPTAEYVHPSVEDHVLRLVAEGGMAQIVDRFDGNFGFVWGFDSPNPVTARDYVQDIAKQVAVDLLGGAALVDVRTIRNTVLDSEPMAEVVQLHG